MPLDTILNITANTRPAEQQIDRLTSRNYGIKLNVDSQPLGRITGQLGEFNKSMDAANARVVAFGASAGAIAIIEKSFSAMVSSAIQVEKSLKDIQVVLDVSGESMAKFGKGLFDIAKNTGQGFNVAAEAATEFSRQGLSMEDTLKRTSDALILSRLSGLGAAESVNVLTAAVNSFANQGVTATEVVNKLATVDSAFAVSSKDLADGISRVGASASQSGVSIDELIGLITSAQQVTARGGAVIGNSFKTIFTRLERGKTQSLLESLGVDTKDETGKIKSTVDMLKDLAKVYGTLGQGQQADVAEKVGGVFQINILKAALGDLGKEHSVYAGAVGISNNATDEATKRNERLNETYAAQINHLQQSATQMAAVAGKKVLGPSMDKVIGAGNGILDNLNNVDSSSIGAKLGNGLLDGIGQVLAGPGVVLFAGVILKLLGDFSKFAAGSTKELLGLNTASKEQAGIQASITKMLEKNPTLLAQINSEAKTQSDQAKILLDHYMKQTAEMQKQATLTGQIAAKLYGGGVRMGSQGVPVTKKAAGYIPEFASEEAQAKMLGAHNPKAEWGKGTIGGQRFIKNSEETEIVGYGINGDSAVIPNYAKGFVPNFAKLQSLGNNRFNLFNDNGELIREKATSKTLREGYRNILTGEQLTELKQPQPLTKREKAINSIDDINVSGRGDKKIVDLGNLDLSTLDPSISNKYGIFFPNLGGGNLPISQSVNDISLLKNKNLRGNVSANLKTASIFPLNSKESDFDNVLQDLFLAPFSALTAKIASTFTKDHKQYPIAAADVNSAFTPSVRGSIFEKALGAASAKSDSTFRESNMSDQAPFDYDPLGNYPPLIGKIGLSSNGAAEAKRSVDAAHNLPAKILTHNASLLAKLMERVKVKLDPRGTKTAAAGYIPNFADALNDSISREISAGAPADAIYVKQYSQLASDINPDGYGVFNRRDEGSMSKEMSAMRKKGYAKGYIPNFAEDNMSGSGSGFAAAGATSIVDLAMAIGLLRSSSGKATMALKENATFQDKARARLSDLKNGSGAMTAAIAAPMIAGQVAQFIPNQTGSQAVSSLGNMASMAGTGAMLGSSLGPVGTAVGAAAGLAIASFTEIPKVVNAFNSNLPELTIAAGKAKDAFQKIQSANQGYLALSEQLQEAMKSGNKGLQEKLKGQLDESFKGYSTEQQSKIIEGTRNGNLDQVLAAIQKEAADINRKTEGLKELQAIRDKIGYLSSPKDKDLGELIGKAVGNSLAGKSADEITSVLKSVEGVGGFKGRIGGSTDLKQLGKGLDALLPGDNNKESRDMITKLATPEELLVVLSLLTKEVSKQQASADNSKKRETVQQQSVKNAEDTSAVMLKWQLSIKELSSITLKQIELTNSVAASTQKANTAMAQSSRAGIMDILRKDFAPSDKIDSLEYSNKAQTINENATIQKSDIVSKYLEDFAANINTIINSKDKGPSKNDPLSPDGVGMPSPQSTHTLDSAEKLGSSSYANMKDNVQPALTAGIEGLSAAYEKNGDMGAFIQQSNELLSSILLGVNVTGEGQQKVLSENKEKLAGVITSLQKVGIDTIQSQKTLGKEQQMEELKKTMSNIHNSLGGVEDFLNGNKSLKESLAAAISGSADLANAEKNKKDLNTQINSGMTSGRKAIDKTTGLTTEEKYNEDIGRKAEVQFNNIKKLVPNFQYEENTGGFNAIKQGRQAGLMTALTQAQLAASDPNDKNKAAKQGAVNDIVNSLKASLERYNTAIVAKGEKAPYENVSSMNLREITQVIGEMQARMATGNAPKEIVSEFGSADEKRAVALNENTAAINSLSSAISGMLKTPSSAAAAPTAPFEGNAAGYLPSMMAEERTARALGAVNPKAMFGKGTIGGKRFIMNDKETEIPGYGRNGDSAVIPHYAEGNIPELPADGEFLQLRDIRRLEKFNEHIRGNIPNNTVFKSQVYQSDGGMVGLRIQDGRIHGFTSGRSMDGIRPNHINEIRMTPEVRAMIEDYRNSNKLVPSATKPVETITENKPVDAESAAQKSAKEAETAKKIQDQKIESEKIRQRARTIEEAKIQNKAIPAISETAASPAATAPKFTPTGAGPQNRGAQSVSPNVAPISQETVKKGIMDRAKGMVTKENIIKTGKGIGIGIAAGVVLDQLIPKSKEDTYDGEMLNSLRESAIAVGAGAASGGVGGAVASLGIDTAIKVGQMGVGVVQLLSISYTNKKRAKELDDADKALKERQQNLKRITPLLGEKKDGMKDTIQQAVAASINKNNTAAYASPVFTDQPKFEDLTAQIEQINKKGADETTGEYRKRTGYKGSMIDGMRAEDYYQKNGGTFISKQKKQAQEFTDSIEETNAAKRKRLGITGSMIDGQSSKGYFAMPPKISTSNIVSEVTQVASYDEKSQKKPATAYEQAYKQREREYLNRYKQQKSGYTDAMHIDDPLHGRAGYAFGHMPSAMMEVNDAKSLGASSPIAMMGEGTIGGKRFMMNSEEMEIPRYGSNGDSAVIPRYATGNVPEAKASNNNISVPVSLNIAINGSSSNGGAASAHSEADDMKRNVNSLVPELQTSIEKIVRETFERRLSSLEGRVDRGAMTNQAMKPIPIGPDKSSVA